MMLDVFQSIQKKGVPFMLVLTGVRTAVFNAVPQPLKAAIAVGIGLFITLIGLVDAGFVRRLPDAANTTVPVGLGISGSIASWPTFVFVVGLLVTGILVEHPPVRPALPSSGKRPMPFWPT